jgi:hypothetical protein
MNGDIRAARLSVEDNAVFSGKVELDGTAATEAGRGGIAAHPPASAVPATPPSPLFGAN